MNALRPPQKTNIDEPCPHEYRINYGQRKSGPSTDPDTLHCMGPTLEMLPQIQQISLTSFVEEAIEHPF